MRRKRELGVWMASGVILAFLFLGARAFVSRRFGEPWLYWPHPEAAGLVGDRLAEIEAYAGAVGTTGLVVVVGGKVALEYGDVTQRGYLAAGRSALLAMLYGPAVEDGRINLNLTLGEIGLDDREGLLPSEKKATIEEVLTGRSGVFHPSAFLWDVKETPPRGSHEPGTRFFYHWWAPLAACGIYELLTDRDFYEALHEDLGKPLGLQSFNGKRHRKFSHSKRSVFWIYDIYMSTRDIARFGQLMLQGGEWQGQQLIPREWVRRISSPVTPPGEVNTEGFPDRHLGYGFQWWVWEDTDPASPFAGAYTYIGQYGQYLTVLPKMDMVVAHQVYAGWYEPDESVTWEEYVGILERLVAAKTTP
jgi:CubicO group peptidase (beta-lactamase class C family)